jgi:hypothetical protein
MRNVIAVFALSISVCALSATACQKNESAPQGSSQAASNSASTTAPKHAPANVVPGSHADWCEEHQVPESMCTRCNPSLVAAFKATGDWCPEHGLPESQCLICNPNLKIERPPQ